MILRHKNERGPRGLVCILIYSVIVRALKLQWSEAEVGGMLVLERGVEKRQPLEAGI